MADNIAPGVHYSTTKVRPTIMTKALPVAVALLGLVSMMSDGSWYGFMLVIIAVAALDAVVSPIVLRNRALTVHTMAGAVESPARIVVHMAAARGVAPIKVSPFPFTAMDLTVDESFVLPSSVDAGPAEGVLVPVGSVGDGAVRNHLRFSTSTSVFGFFEADRVAIYVPFAALSRTPEFSAPSDQKLMADAEAGQIRPYLPGDPRSRVAWKTTARTGELHVRGQRDEDNDVTVLVDLGYMSQGFDVASTQTSTKSLAGGVITDLLDLGVAVHLHTLEVGSAYYENELDQALKHPRKPATPYRPGSFPSHLVDRIVFSRSDLIERLASAVAARDLPRPNGPYLLVADGVVKWEGGQ